LAENKGIPLRGPAACALGGLLLILALTCALAHVLGIGMGTLVAGNFFLGLLIFPPLGSFFVALGLTYILQDTKSPS